MKAIQVESLSKRYRIGVRERHARTLREYLLRILSSPWDYLRTTLRRPSQDEILWALRDVSFEVERGEAVGIIGANGAGKSTLLKVLSRITEPTSGRVFLRGRVSSLLEVGTGFHRELSGRDNVYLNGAILGMTRREIEAKFDRIVAFSGLEKFMDTPVKRYSSGMHMRLAFAVAAHLEPEILLIDEVLAVGDAEFRKKCLGKMGDVARSGRTILFVSHNLGAVRELCPTCMWIDQGKIVSYGPSAEVVQRYLRTLGESAGEAYKSFPEKPGTDFQVLRIRLLSWDGEITESHDCDQPMVIELLCHLRRTIASFRGYLEITAGDGTIVLASETSDHPPDALAGLSLGKSLVRVTIPARTLAPGEYHVHLRFKSAPGFTIDSPESACTFRLNDHRTQRGNTRVGFFSTILSWEVGELQEVETPGAVVSNSR